MIAMEMMATKRVNELGFFFNLFKIDVFINTCTLDYACSKFYVVLSLPFPSVLRVLQTSDVYWRRVTVKYSSKFFTSGL